MACSVKVKGKISCWILNPVALRKAKIVYNFGLSACKMYNFGLSECNRVKKAMENCKMSGKSGKSQGIGSEEVATLIYLGLSNVLGI